MTARMNGPQRAERRAVAKGLTVGRSVAAQCRGWWGVGDPPSSRHYVPREERTYAGPGGATPLGRVDRMARYLLQRDVTTHVRHGVNWQPTPRQRRRLDHKARHALAPFKPGNVAEAYVASNTPAWPTVDQRIETGVATVRQDDPEFVPKVVAALLDPANTVAAWNEPARVGVAPPVMMQNPPERERSAMNRGFRVVDRRGEHRS